MLRVTSALFGTVVLHAYYRQCAAFHHLFLLVTLLSVVFHVMPSPPKWLRLADKATAHAAFLFILLAQDTAQAPWLLCFPMMVLMLWYGQTLQNAHVLHVALHVVSIVGLHCYLHALY
jgi:hypothetical protein